VFITRKKYMLVIDYHFSYDSGDHSDSIIQFIFIDWYR
jgi:hypothetical protein